MSRRKNADIGKNRYGLDMSYFRNLFDRELNKPLADFTPKELARVLARASRTADPGVMHEPEFLPGMAIVPVEPNQAMLEAGVSVALSTSIHGQGGWNAYLSKLYAAMLAATKEKGE